LQIKPLKFEGDISMNKLKLISVVVVGVLCIVSGCSSKQSENAPLSYEENPEITTSKNTKPSSIGEGSFSAKVKYITDGDTLKVVATDSSSEYVEAGQEIEIRLLLIDSPEWTTKKMPWGDQATARVKKLIPAGTKITLYYDLGNKQDRYDRHLVYLQLPNGELLQQKLLEEGLATVRYIIPPGTTMLSEFKSAEKRARESKLNVWSVPGYVKPNEGYNPVVVDGPLSEKSLKDSADEILGKKAEEVVEDTLKDTLGEEGGAVANEVLGDSVDSVVEDSLDSISQILE
jgi:endonuclease YncB( thermonuclease family)